MQKQFPRTSISLKKRACTFAACLALSACVLSVRAQSSAAVPQGDAEGGSGSVPQPSLKGGVLPARLSDVEGPIHIVVAAQGEPSASAQTPGQVPPPPPDQVPTEAKMNMPVPAGTGLQTGEDGRAELQFDDGSIARIAPGSAATLTRLRTSGEQLTAVAGLTYYETAPQSSGELAVHVGAYTVSLSADTLIRVDLDQSPDTIAVIRGSATLDSQDGSVALQEGQTATLNSLDDGGPKVSSQIASNSWDAWNADRDAQLGEMAAGETNAREGSSYADAGAWDDLDYYGTWYDVPGVGEAWAPDGVNADFDPYGDGAWTYYTNIGYVWVSAYPWGWLPYHCGIWSYYNNFGWLWQPGACGTFDGGGWFPYTAVFHPPHGYRLPGHGALHPFDPRLRTHLGGTPMPPIQAYQPVQRGQHFQFRALGGSRPDPRALPVNNHVAHDGGPIYASTLPVLPGLSGQYRSGSAGSSFTGGDGTAAADGRHAEVHNQHVRSVYVPHSVFTPHENRQGNIPVFRNGDPGHVPVIPAPHYDMPRPTPRPAPVPHYAPPPPHYAPPAPHFSAPAPRAAPSPRGH